MILRWTADDKGVGGRCSLIFSKSILTDCLPLNFEIAKFCSPSLNVKAGETT